MPFDGTSRLEGRGHDPGALVPVKTGQEQASAQFGQRVGGKRPGRGSGARGGKTTKHCVAGRKSDSQQDSAGDSAYWKLSFSPGSGQGTEISLPCIDWVT